MGNAFQNTGLVWMCLKKLNIELPYDPAVSLLGMYSRELKTGMQTKPCVQMFIVAPKSGTNSIVRRMNG